VLLLSFLVLLLWTYRACDALHRLSRWEFYKVRCFGFLCLPGMQARGTFRCTSFSLSSCFPLPACDLPVGHETLTPEGHFWLFSGEQNGYHFIYKANLPTTGSVIITSAREVMAPLKPDKISYSLLK
jgi:hypothetical protein